MIGTDEKYFITTQQGTKRYKIHDTKTQRQNRTDSKYSVYRHKETQDTKTEQTEQTGTETEKET